MMGTVSLTIVAMTFGGVMEKTGMLRALVEKILYMAHNAAGLITATIASAILTNATTSEQYISILLPGRMYVEAFRRMRLKSKNLSRALEDGGTVTSVLVPWNTCGVFASSMLGVTAFEYGPYAVLNYSIPILAIIMAFPGHRRAAHEPPRKRLKWSAKSAANATAHSKPAPRPEQSQGQGRHGNFDSR